MSETAKKKKSSRAGKDNLVWDEKFLQKVEAAAAKGNTYTAICDSLGISERSLYTHKRKSAQFAQAIKKGRGRAVSIIECDLFNDARMPGNTTAKIYFLKNRCPDEWKDKHEVEATVDVDYAERLKAAYKRDEELDLERNSES